MYVVHIWQAWANLLRVPQYPNLKKSATGERHRKATTPAWCAMTEGVLCWFESRFLHTHAHDQTRKGPQCLHAFPYCMQETLAKTFFLDTALGSSMRSESMHMHQTKSVGSAFFREVPYLCTFSLMVLKSQSRKFQEFDNEVLGPTGKSEIH